MGQHCETSAGSATLTLPWRRPGNGRRGRPAGQRQWTTLASKKMDLAKLCTVDHGRFEEAGRSATLESRRPATRGVLVSPSEPRGPDLAELLLVEVLAGAVDGVRDFVPGFLPRSVPTNVVPGMRAPFVLSYLEVLGGTQPAPKFGLNRWTVSLRGVDRTVESRSHVPPMH